MVTLQDISFRLMKPAKDLADWNFPLSQVLEEYYALLEEPCDINFGEAALVLQNSANIYVHRIECLFGETERFKHSFIEYRCDSLTREEETKAPSRVKRGRGTIGGYTNFEDFVSIDFEKGTGKNIDAKKRYSGQGQTKLLGRRFTQLENGTSELRIPIQVYDVCGEVMGKKYDFRCNRDTNADGALVDELTPNDFTIARGSSIKERRNPSFASSEAYTRETGTSGYHSHASPFGCSVTADVSTEDLENGPCSPRSFSRITDSIKETDGKGKIPNDRGLPFVSTTTSKETAIQNEANAENSENRSDIEEQSKKSGGKAERSGSPLCESTRELAESHIRRSERRKKSIAQVADIDEELWRPIPFTRGTKNCRSEYSSPVKLPHYVSSCKAKLEPISKRKLDTGISGHECLAEFVLRELASTEKDLRCPATKSTFRPLRKQELEDFQRSFDECFSGSSEFLCRSDTRYEPVNGMSAQLLEFRLCHGENTAPESNSTTEERNHCPSPTFFEPNADCILPDAEEFSTETSPRDDEFLDTDLAYSLPRYRALIESKMREILERTNVATELEQTVAKWHESLQARLTEAEHRSTFSIHDYATQILGTLEALEQRKITFDSVVRGKPACEVARYFLASLQLANTYNVQINTNDSGSSNIEIILLDGRRRAVENYKT